MSQPRNILIDDATKAELIQFASVNLGLDIPTSMKLDDIQAEISKAGWHGDHIILYTDEEPTDNLSVSLEPIDAQTAEEKERAKILAHARSSRHDPKVNLTLNQVQGVGGQRPLFMQVNNIPMLIPRGRPVDVPYRYYLALRSSEARLWEQDENTQEMIPRDVAAHPFTVHRLPTAEEMRPWLENEHRAQYPPGKAPETREVAII